MPTAPTKRPGPRGVNWLKARTLYLEGKTLSAIARELDVRRQTVSLRAISENWGSVRAEIGQRVVAEAVESNVAVLKKHDELASRLLGTAKAWLDDVAAGKRPYDVSEARHVATIVARSAAVQRQSRGMSDDESMVERVDKTFVVNVRRMPDNEEEYRVLEAFRAQKGASDGVA